MLFSAAQVTKNNHGAIIRLCYSALLINCGRVRPRNKGLRRGRSNWEREIRRVNRRERFIGKVFLFELIERIDVTSWG